MKLLLAILLLAPLPSGIEKTGEIQLDQIAGRQKGTRFALRWSATSCEAGAASPGARMAWRKAPVGSCRRLREHLAANLKSLEKTQLSAESRIPVIGHSPVGLLKLGQHRWRVNLSSERLCDEKGNCARLARSPGTELGTLVREIVLEIHGLKRPPPAEWGPADEAAASE